METNESVLIIILATLGVLFLLAFQQACMEWNVNNDAFYLERLRIEEGS